MKNILNNINLKQIIKDHITDNGGQVVQSENWIDLDYTHTGNTYNQNAPIVIQVKVIEAQNPDQTTAFITFHNGGDPRGNYETDTYIIQGESIYDTSVKVYSGEQGRIVYDWNTGETTYTTDDQGEQWTIDPMNGTIYHTDGDQPAPLDTLTAIVNAIYDTEISDFTVEE